MALSPPAIMEVPILPQQWISSHGTVLRDISNTKEMLVTQIILSSKSAMTHPIISFPAHEKVSSIEN